MTNIGGSGSGSISQKHGSADPDPDPHQNVMDPQHCFTVIFLNAVRLHYQKDALLTHLVPFIKEEGFFNF
jgi:hypothetical protein